MSEIAIAAALVGAGATVSAGAAIKSSQAQASQAKSQRNIAQFNAALAERDARTEEARTALEQQRASQEAQRQQSTLRAQLGASGAVVGEGATLRIEAEQAEESELQNLLIGYGGQLNQARFRTEAANLTAQSRLYGQQASNIRTAGFIQAGSTLLTGFGQAAAIKSRSSDYTSSAGPNAVASRGR